MPPIDEDAFWKTLVDCKASRYLTASEVQFLLKYRTSVEAGRAEHDRHRAELDSVGRLLAAACSAAPPCEDSLARLLERQPPADAGECVARAFVVAVRLFLNRAAVREGLSSCRSHRADRVTAAMATSTGAAFAASLLDCGAHFKKALRKLDSKAYQDAVETDLKCCQKLLSQLHGHGHNHGGADSTGGPPPHAPTDDTKAHVKHKRHSLPLTGKNESGGPAAAAANEQVVQKLFPLQKLMYTHPACERLSEDAAFKNGNLEDKIKYLLDVAHRRPAPPPQQQQQVHPASATEDERVPPQISAVLRRTVGTQCDVKLRPVDERSDVAIDATTRLCGGKTRRRASEPTEFRGRRVSREAGGNIGGDALDGGVEDLANDKMDGGVEGLADDSDYDGDKYVVPDVATLLEVPHRDEGRHRMEALREALGRTSQPLPPQQPPLLPVQSAQPQKQPPSAKTEREMLMYIAREIQDEWLHVFRDLMSDAKVPLDDVEVIKAEIELNYGDTFLQAYQSLERWRRATGAFELQRLRKVFESRHRRDLINYMEDRVARASRAAAAATAAYERGLN